MYAVCIFFTLKEKKKKSQNIINYNLQQINTFYPIKSKKVRMAPSIRKDHKPKPRLQSTLPHSKVTFSRAGNPLSTATCYSLTKNFLLYFPLSDQACNFCIKLKRELHILCINRSTRLNVFQSKRLFYLLQCSWIKGLILHGHTAQKATLIQHMGLKQI